MHRRSLYTEAINHDPAITFFQTGSQIAGRPSMGAWLSYGLGTANENLPTFCVLSASERSISPFTRASGATASCPRCIKACSSGPGRNRFSTWKTRRASRRPAGRMMLDRLRELHQMEYDATLDPAIQAPDRPVRDGLPHANLRARSHGHRQRARPHLRAATAPTPESPARSRPTACWPAAWPSAASGSSSSTTRAGTTTATCPAASAQQCRETDQACAALIQDLKQRGMLDDTLVIWGGEFGRTNYSQGKLTATDYGRDHHPRCFTVWAAGGGIKPGLTYGETDPFGYNIVEDPVHVHDFHATILHLLGIDHERLTYKHQGRYYRLTDVAGRVVKGILA